MMNNYWHGYGGGGTSIIGGVLMMAFWVAIIVGIVLLIVWFTRHAGGTHLAAGATGQGGSHVETAKDILDNRYARGEIDKTEYEEKKKALTG